MSFFFFSPYLCVTLLRRKRFFLWFHMGTKIRTRASRIRNIVCVCVYNTMCVQLGRSVLEFSITMDTILVSFVRTVYVCYNNYYLCRKTVVSTIRRK